MCLERASVWIWYDDGAIDDFRWNIPLYTYDDDDDDDKEPPYNPDNYVTSCWIILVGKKTGEW